MLICTSYSRSLRPSWIGHVSIIVQGVATNNVQYFTNMRVMVQFARNTGSMSVQNELENGWGESIRLGFNRKMR